MSRAIMARPRIHIIGGPGSGKSFAAGALSARLGVPAHDLDELFWDPAAPRRGVRTDAAERDRRLAALVAGDGWVIEGVYYGWLGPSFDAADVVIALTPSIWVRHWRVIRRFVRRRRGGPGAGAAGEAPKRESLRDLGRLLRWSHAYDRRHLAEARVAIAARGRHVVACETLADVLAATAHLGPPREVRAPTARGAA